MQVQDYKNDLENLIERWFSLDRQDVTYEELLELEKERTEIMMGDIIEKHPELEDAIPSPICYR